MRFLAARCLVFDHLLRGVSNRRELVSIFCEPILVLSVASVRLLIRAFSRTLLDDLIVDRQVGEATLLATLLVWNEPGGVLETRMILIVKVQLAVHV